MSVPASSSVRSLLGLLSGPANGSNASATVVPAAKQVGIAVLPAVEEQLGMTRTQSDDRRQR